MLLRYNDFGAIPSVARDNLAPMKFSIPSVAKDSEIDQPSYSLRTTKPIPSVAKDSEIDQPSYSLRTTKPIPSVAKDSQIDNINDLSNILSKPPTLSWRDVPHNRRYLDDGSKYNIFTKMYPENTCKGVSLHINKNKVYAFPDNQTLRECILDKEQSGISVAINFISQERINLMWFDTINRVINRYEPRIAGNNSYEGLMDDNIREYFLQYLPNYEYIGNTLSSGQCIKISDDGEHQQDYCLLYAINRINGMDVYQAAESLSSMNENILTTTDELMEIFDEVLDTLLDK